jgi:hypothetical protein
MTKKTKEQVEMALALVEFIKRHGFSIQHWNSEEQKKVNSILLEVDCESVRREFSIIPPKPTYRLKVAVGRSGKLVVLEGFPDDETHRGLHEMVPELECGEYQQKPGVYMADVVLDQCDGGTAGPEYANAYLNIIRFIEM